MNAPIGKKQARTIVRKLREVRRIATMLTMVCGDICSPSSTPHFKDGRAVTEGNLSDFIRERLEPWRETWVIEPLDDIIKEIEEHV